MKGFLTKTTSLWFFLGLSLLLLIFIEVVKNKWNLVLLDTVSKPIQVRDALEHMSVEQSVAHAWLTATLDVLLPLSIGALIAGVTLISFAKYANYLLLVPLLAIVVDLIEGVIQVFALLDIAYFLGVKSFVTPLKMLLFAIGIGIILFAWTKWILFKLFSARA